MQPLSSNDHDNVARSITSHTPDNMVYYFLPYVVHRTRSDRWQIKNSLHHMTEGAYMPQDMIEQYALLRRLPGPVRLHCEDDLLHLIIVIPPITVQSSFGERPLACCDHEVLTLRKSGQCHHTHPNPHPNSNRLDVLTLKITPAGMQSCTCASDNADDTTNALHCGGHGAWKDTMP
jgi:hypothetical protein